MANEQNLILFKSGQSGNPNGRPKGRKSLSTIIRELEDEEFDWSKLPIKDKAKLDELMAQFGPVGSPLRVIVYKALIDSIFGVGAEKIAARDFLRKAGYGDKLDLTSKGERIKQEPIIVSTINARHVDTETKTTEGT